MLCCARTKKNSKSGTAEAFFYFEEFCAPSHLLMCKKDKKGRGAPKASTRAYHTNSSFPPECNRLFVLGWGCGTRNRGKQVLLYGW